MMNAKTLLKTNADQTRVSDRWTRFLAASEFGHGGSFGEAVHAAFETVPSAGAEAMLAFSREVFGDLYDGGMVVLEGEERGEYADQIDAWWPTDHEPNDDASKSVYDEWASQREKCAGDAMRSGMVAASFVEAAARALCDAAIEEEEKGNSSVNPIDGQLTDAVKKRAAETIRKNRGVAAIKARKAGENLDSNRKAIGTSAGNKPGTPISRAPSRDILDEMRTNRKFRSVMRLIGRMRPIVRSMRTKTKVEWMRDEVVGIELGGEIARMLPSEVAMMADPDAELDLMRRIAERQIFQRSMVGMDDAGRGPVVFCLDESGSMDGERDEWAKAVAISMAEVAMKEGRSFALVHFDSRVARVDLVKSKISLSKLEEMIGYFSGGGTAFGPPIAKAMEIIRKERVFRRADIVLLTDGQGAIDKATSDEIARIEAKLHVVLIGSNDIPYSLSVADSVASIPNLNPDSIKNMSIAFRSI